MPYGITTTNVASVSHAGIVIGVFAALVCQIILNLLGLGLGSLAMPVTAQAETVSWSAFLWWAVAGIIAAFVGGWTAGWMGAAREGSPGLHGLATWAITTVLIVVGASFFASAGTAIGFLAGPSFTAMARNPSTGDLAASQNVIGTLALASFVALIIGAFAAYYGAQMAAMREVRLHPHMGHGQAM